MAVDVVKVLQGETAHSAPLARQRESAANAHDDVLDALPRLAIAFASRPSLQVIADLAADALRPLHAVGAAVLAIDDDGSVIDIAASGVSNDVLERLGPMVLDGSSPILGALATRTAIWLDSRARVAELFPPFAALDMPWKSYAAAPLIVAGRLAGAVAIPFSTQRRFTAVDRTCIRSMYALLAYAVDEFRHAADLGERPGPPLRPLLERIADGVLILDVRADRIVYANPAMAALTGIDPSALATMGRDDLVSHLKTRWHGRAESQHGRVQAFENSVDCCTVTAADGTERDLELHHSDVDQNGYRMTVVIEVTGRASPENRAAVLSEALWAERDRLARDLHDGVVQSVFATSLTLAAAAVRAPEAVRADIEEAIDGLDGVVQQLRSTVFGLARPRETGGDAADLLRTIAAKSARGLGFQPTLECIGDIELVSDPDLLGHIVLAAREALSNVARHAHASAVAITLDVCSTSVDLVIADNGIGFTTDHPSGDGLDNLRQRAEERGGTCTVASRPSGTTVRWSVPLRR